MFDKDLFIAGLRQGWRSARQYDGTVFVVSCAVTSVATVMALILHARIN